MTNKEKYKQAFSAIHISDDFSLEVNTMTTTHHKLNLNRLVAGFAACVLLVATATAAYATDLGGIQRKLQLWIHGDQTAVTIQFDGGGHYTMDYEDDQGAPTHQGGGGVAIEDNGEERPLTEAELLEELARPEVSYLDDGSVWVYWFDQTIEITDKFENNVCYIKLVNGQETLYMTVRYQAGFSTSPDKYLAP